MKRVIVFVYRHKVISEAPPRTSSKIVWASRYDDGGEFLVLSNRSFSSSPFHSFFFLYPRMLNECTLVVVLWRIIPPNSDRGGRRSYTRHHNWNVKVRQNPMHYRFNNSIVTQLCWSVMAYITCSSIEIQNRISVLPRAGNNKLNPQKQSTLLSMRFLVYFTNRKGNSILCTICWRATSDTLFLCCGKDLLTTKRLLFCRRSDHDDPVRTSLFW